MNQPQQTVRVDLADRAYDIVVGEGLLCEVGRFVADRSRATLAAVMTDSNVAPLYAERVKESLDAACVKSMALEIEAGEPSKAPAVAVRLWNELLAAGADRKSCVIALGGGVVGDLAGFVAATFGRGIDFFQVPTSLLAMVDSSVGGKVGVNLPAAKNIVGAFWQPKSVLIDTAALDTLPRREYLAGLSEVVKYGVIMDADFFGYLEEFSEAILARDPAAVANIVARSCRLKADVVEADETEVTGRRAILNYGHTFGHAVESVTGYGTVLHGEAVSIGMTAAGRLAVAKTLWDETSLDRQTRLLARLGLPIETPPGLDPHRLLAAMHKDKKATAGRISFVLPTRLGASRLFDDVSDEEALAAFSPPKR